MTDFKDTKMNKELTAGTVMHVQTVLYGHIAKLNKVINDPNIYSELYINDSKHNLKETQKALAEFKADKLPNPVKGS